MNRPMIFSAAGVLPLSSLKAGLPETWPEPQCVGSDQPCAEQAQQANNQAKNKDKASDK